MTTEIQTSYNQGIYTRIIYKLRTSWPIQPQFIYKIKPFILILADTFALVRTLRTAAKLPPFTQVTQIY